MHQRPAVCTAPSNLLMQPPTLAATAIATVLTFALKQTNMHTLAGDHPPPPGFADEIAYVITVGHDTLRTSPAADGSVPPPKLKPLLTVLDEIVSTGRRRVASAS
jgi:hypothetical protein